MTLEANTSKDKSCFNGKIVTRKSKTYNKDRQIYNTAIQKFPKAIVYCKSTEDVACAVKDAFKKRCPVRVRSGGHNYEGYSTGNNIVVIDVSKMRKIRINYKENTVTIQSGVENYMLYDFLGKRGYPFPGGTCPTVGLSGYSLGGGWGLSARLFGLGTDSLVEAEIVNYEGEALKANKRVNTDLFWALRGAGGGNFGVVTSLKFKLPPKVKYVTIFRILYSKTSQKEQAYVMNLYQNLFKHLDRRANIRASFYNSHVEGKGIDISGIFYGKEKEIKAILNQFLRLSNVSYVFRYVTFLEAISLIEDLYPASEKFKDTGAFSNRMYTKDELYNLAGVVRSRPEGSIFTAVTFYGLGGAVKDVGSRETAFYYRDSNYIIGMQTVWEEEKFAKENRKWLDNKVCYLKTLTEGFYVNFPYNLLKDYEKAYYGENIYRLTKIKKKYDPFNFFHFPQSIRITK
ncbi:MAG: FAD-binding oxidoreductase [Clostridium sp.]|nr:FAD-binding oxidoreductase [Clostridium sp.]